jgi:hypothetical protein
MKTKLTAAQAYALQVKADRRAAARERANVSVAADNNRVNAMFAATEVVAPKVAKTKQPAVRKYAPWSMAEYRSIVNTYLRLSAGGAVIKDEVIAEHAIKYPRRSEGAVSFVVSHLKGLDVAHESELSLTVSEGLMAAAYEADSARFATCAAQEAKVVDAIDSLLAELR